MLVSGHLLDNRYRLDERIATGGMGDVWRGTDVVLGRVVAVKVLKAGMLADPEFAARFYGEARVLAAFRHPNVVEVYDYNSSEGTGDDDQGAYLVMGYVDGEPLSTKLKDQGRLAVAETLSIMAQTADALHAAHSNGTVHRDVKPGNIMVKPNGTVVLVDFGVARSLAMTSVTGVNSIVGTALYMAPEQVSKGDLSPATDIYALGAVAYHCLSGNPPFDGDNALQVALRHLEDEPEPLPADVPGPVRALIARAMAKNPADRWSSAAEFAEAAIAVAEPGDWRTTTGTGTRALTGMSLTTAGATAPLSRAATTAVPRPVSPGGPTTMPGRRPPSRDSKRGPVLLAAALLVVAGALTAIVATLADGDAGGNGTPGVTAPAQVPSDGPVEETRDTDDGPTNRPGNQPVQPSAAPPSNPVEVPSVTPSPPAATTGGPTTGGPTTGPTGDGGNGGNPDPTDGQQPGEPTTPPATQDTTTGEQAGTEPG